MRRREPTFSESFDTVRADYDAAKRSSRFVPRRRGVPAQGAGADYHYRTDGDYLWMQESARELYRNDPVLGQLTDRAVVNTIGSGFKPDPDTGDKGLDAELKARFAEESEDPDYCDTAGELTFREQEAIAARELLVPGDIFGKPTPDGTVELLESHRCRSPQRTTRAMVHGVEMQKATRKRIAYYFTRDSIDPLTPQAQVKMKDLQRVSARDSEGEANIWHVYSPKRSSQTRGVSAYAPVIVLAGMFGDLNFSNLLKSQMNSHWLLVRNREKGYFDNNPVQVPLGPTNDTFTGTRSVQDIAPGSEIGGQAGEKIEAWAPNTPNAEFFPHARLLLTMIGINIGMPLVLVLLDASETNFSGYRGAVDQARLGFRHNQDILKLRWHRPWWRFKTNIWADADPAIAARRESLGARFFKHRWQAPGWPYIEPTKDATADLIRASSLQTSHRRLCSERGGMEWPEIVEEMVSDRELAIIRAATSAQKINEQFKFTGGDVVSWRDLAPLPTPERVTVALKGEDAPENQPHAKPKSNSAAAEL